MESCTSFFSVDELPRFFLTLGALHVVEAVIVVEFLSTLGTFHDLVPGHLMGPETNPCPELDYRPVDGSLIADDKSTSAIGTIIGFRALKVLILFFFFWIY